MPKSTSLKIPSVFGSPLKIFALLFVMWISAYSTPLSLKYTSYFHPEASVSIVLFYTTWCPPCQRALILLDDIAAGHPHLHLERVCIDDPAMLKQNRTYGILQTVPLILVADRSGTVVKQFTTLPKKEIITALIQRLEEGRLENGTLPIEQRIDTWKMNRKGM